MWTYEYIRTELKGCVCVCVCVCVYELIGCKYLLSILGI